MTGIFPIRRKTLYYNHSQQLSSTELYQLNDLRLSYKNTTLELVSSFIMWRFQPQVSHPAARSDILIVDSRKSAYWRIHSDTSRPTYTLQWKKTKKAYYIANSFRTFLCVDLTEIFFVNTKYLVISNLHMQRNQK